MGANFTGASYMDPTMGQRWQRFSEGNILRQHPKATPVAIVDTSLKSCTKPVTFLYPGRLRLHGGEFHGCIVHESNDGSTMATIFRRQHPKATPVAIVDTSLKS